MAIIIDPPFDLAFTIYGIPWPDIDEEKIGEFGEKFDRVCEDTANFGRALEGLLAMLAEQSESQAFSEITALWSSVTASEVYPVIENVDDVVRVMADLIEKAITSYKLSLLAFLGWNIGSDILLLAVPGPGTAAVAATVPAKRIFLRQAQYQAAEMFVEWILNIVEDRVEEMILAPLRRVFQDVRDRIVVQLAAGVSGDENVRGATLRATGSVLDVDFDEVVTATKKLLNAGDALLFALDAYLGQAASDDLEEPNINAVPERDSTVRDAVERVLRWALGEVVKLLADVALQIVKDLGQLILDTYHRYVEADSMLAARAAALREELLARPGAAAFSIERTMRPTRTTLWGEPPRELFTGEAVSPARLGIEIIDLPDDPEVVITGPAQSDARLGIRVITLPDLTPSGDQKEL